jgi:predicted AAA+ superfamily ATPase
MFQRLISLTNSSTHSAFILGPRGTGKTSWLKEKFTQALYFDLLDDRLYTEFLANPTRLGDRIPEDFKDYIVVDEIQKIPSLLNEVHRLIEHRKLKFVLTGSSARSLRRKGINLLAGRALTYHMYPLTALELGSKFSLSHSLAFGHLPSVYGHDDPKHYLSSYISTYLKEEVQQEGITRNLALFTRFLETASFSQGEILNYTNIAQEIGSTRHTVANFFDVLEDLLIGYRLPVFTKRAKRETVSHPKFYYFDVGVYRHIRPMGPLDNPTEVDGPALETLFLQEVKAMNEYFGLEYEVFYWRTRSQIEVDFVLYGKNGLLAFEIKRKSKLNGQDFSGLRAFKDDYPIAKCTVLYGGTECYTDRDIAVIPFEKAITQLKSLLAPS